MEWTELYFKIKIIAHVVGFVLVILLFIIAIIIGVIQEAKKKK